MKLFFKSFLTLMAIAILSTCFFNCQKAVNPLSTEIKASTVKGSAQSILPTDTTLVGYWKMDDSHDRSVIPDSSIYQYNLHSTNNFPYISGKKGLAICINQDANYSPTFIGLYTNNKPTLKLNIIGSISIELWIKKSGYNTAASETIISKGFNAGRCILGYQLIIIPTGQLCFIGGGIYKAFSFQNIYDDQWHHIAVTGDSSTGIGTFYLDGASISTFGFSSIRDASTSPFMIGANASYQLYDFFSGALDEVAIYNRALTSEEVLDHYNN